MTTHNQTSDNYQRIETDALALPVGVGAPAPTPRAVEGMQSIATRVPTEAVDESSPRLVTRGESLDTPLPQAGVESFQIYAGRNGQPRIEFTPLPKDGVTAFAALTDWLNITFPFEGSPEALASLSRRIAENLTPKFGTMTDRGRGLHGFKHSCQFSAGGVMLAYGGQNGRAMLTIPGEGCALIADWQAAYQFFRDDLKARISRWDGAVDDFEGNHTVDTAMAWYLDGQFGTHGNQPKMSQCGNWEKPDGCGRTLYIGSGKNGKLLRVYEKGKQLGDKDSPWVRWELQLGNKDRFIPLEVLLNPGPYVAGGYTCLGWISEEASRIRTISKTAEISYDHMIRYARIGYGKLLYVMCEVEGSAEAAFEKLVVPGMPRRLQMPDIDMPSGGI